MKACISDFWVRNSWGSEEQLQNALDTRQIAGLADTNAWSGPNGSRDGADGLCTLSLEAMR